MQHSRMKRGAGESLASSPAVVSAVFGPAETLTYSDRWNGHEDTRTLVRRQDAGRMPA